MKNRINRLFRACLITILSVVAVSTITQAEETSVAGAYVLIKVNDATPPAVSWTKTTNDKTCKEVILSGSLLLDSKGRAAAFATTRYVCWQTDGSETVNKQGSTLFTGTYTIMGEHLSLQFDGFDDPDNGVFKGDILVVTSKGVGDYEGINTDFSFERT